METIVIIFSFTNDGDITSSCITIRNLRTHSSEKKYSVVLHDTLIVLNGHLFSMHQYGIDTWFKWTITCTSLRFIR